ncbi:hypothetical protein [Patulibacter sp.]|uniref:hypothetical protein n=1 Tax=Patulibacter sp. TaxID=1912859 RepID=UPI002717509F|nr:hypothetical protein [Patulibacter sp.]MDO9410626.1 hypothetical protein [Patulibacter sp.]
MSRIVGLLLGPRDLRPAALAVLALAAVAVGVGAWEHARLYHDGYSSIRWIGPLFLVNAITSLVVILLLIARRPVLFVLGSLAISLGSIVAIVLTRNGDGLFGFRESGYAAAAGLTLGAEIVAVLLTVAGVVLGRGALGLDPPPPPSEAPRTEVLV